MNKYVTAEVIWSAGQECKGLYLRMNQLCQYEEKETLPGLNRPFTGSVAKGMLRDPRIEERQATFVHSFIHFCFFVGFFVRLKIENRHKVAICKVSLNNISAGAGLQQSVQHSFQPGRLAESWTQAWTLPL